MIVVTDYDPRWPDFFDELRTTLWPALADVALAIEHVGSTSVPGLAAKPVIDVDVVVPPNRVRAGIARLASLGYEHRGDLGIPEREAFRAPDDATLRHHLYLCPSDSPALANHLAVRDHLRAHAARARAYGALKKRLAFDLAHDSEAYGTAKTDFLLAILRESGFDPQTLRDIERMNGRP